MEFQPGGFEVASETGTASGAGADWAPAERRSEPRHESLIDSATLFYRAAVYAVPVVNISSRGTMIESELEPRLGESVRIQFAGCSPLYAFVRWARDGRIGLKFGCELILG